MGPFVDTYTMRGKNEGVDLCSCSSSSFYRLPARLKYWQSWKVMIILMIKVIVAVVGNDKSGAYLEGHDRIFCTGVGNSLQKD